MRGSEYLFYCKCLIRMMKFNRMLNIRFFGGTPVIFGRGEIEKTCCFYVVENTRF